MWTNYKEKFFSCLDINAQELTELAAALGIACQEFQDALMNAVLAAEDYGKLAKLARDERRLLRESSPLPKPARGLPASAKHYRLPVPKPRPTARAHIRNIRDVKGRPADRK